jgi:hypothetical protein
MQFLLKRLVLYFIQQKKGFTGTNCQISQNPTCLDFNPTFCTYFASLNFCTPYYYANGKPILVSCSQSCSTCSDQTTIQSSSTSSTVTTRPSSTTTTTRSTTSTLFNPSCQDLNPSFCLYFISKCGQNFYVNSRPFSTQCKRTCGLC